MSMMRAKERAALEIEKYDGKAKSGKIYIIENDQ